MSKIIKDPLSAEGKYYVDANVCMICNTCAEEAPSNFIMGLDKSNLGNSSSYVYKQPQTREEEKLCQDALNCCPVEAIGDDGELAN